MRRSSPFVGTRPTAMARRGRQLWRAYPRREGADDSRSPILEGAEDSHTLVARPPRFKQRGESSGHALASVRFSLDRSSTRTARTVLGDRRIRERPSAAGCNAATEAVRVAAMARAAPGTSRRARGHRGQADAAAWTVIGRPRHPGKRFFITKNPPTRTADRWAREEDQAAQRRSQPGHHGGRRS